MVEKDALTSTTARIFLCSCSYLLPIHKSINKSFIGNIITIDSENINSKAVTIASQICYLYDKPRSTVISASFSTILLFQKLLYLITLPILHLAEKFAIPDNITNPSSRREIPLRKARSTAPASGDRPRRTGGGYLHVRGIPAVTSEHRMSVCFSEFNGETSPSTHNSVIKIPFFFAFH